MRVLLLRIRRADYQGTADLRVVTVDAWRELGRNHVARFETAAARGPHAADLRPADPDDLEIVIDALSPEERFNLGNQLVIGAAHPRGLAEHRIAFVCKLGGAAHRGQLP